MSETTNPKAHVVRLPDDVIAKCSSYAADVAARYGGDDLHAMPWTRDQMTDEECQQWLASRKEAALKIDIETCELGRWAANDFDPYGLRTDLTEESIRSERIALSVRLIAVAGFARTICRWTSSTRCTTASIARRIRTRTISSNQRTRASYGKPTTICGGS
jgi:hypothetical protein